MKIIDDFKNFLGFNQHVDIKNSTTLKKYLYRPILENETLDIYFIKNNTNNEIEKNVAQSLVRLFKSKEFRSQNLNITDHMETAECVIFMLSENLSQEDYDKMSALSDQVVKIGIVTSAYENQFNMENLNNLIVVTQSINSKYPYHKLKQALKVNDKAKFIKLPLVPFIYKKKQVNNTKTYSIDYYKYTMELGLYEVIASALPSEYNSLEIICQSYKQAIQLKDHFIYFNKDTFVHNNKCIIKLNNSLFTENIALQKHATIKLLRIIRKSLEPIVHERTNSR